MLNVMVLPAIVSALGAMVASAVSDDEFAVAMYEMLNVTGAANNYAMDYIAFVVEFNKTGDYLIDGSDDYAELSTRYQRYVESEHFVAELNANFSETVNVYNFVDGNYTDEINYTTVVSPYGHTYFSDIFDEERLALLMNETFADDVNSWPASCTLISGGNTYGSGYTNEHCDGVKAPRSDGFSWAYAAAAQAECNYNMWTSNTGSNCDLCVSVECQVAACSGAGTLRGGSFLSATSWFVGNAYCANYSAGWPSCFYAQCLTCPTPKPEASSCNILSSANNKLLTFWNANRQLSRTHFAMAFGAHVGQDFFQLTGDAPVSSICRVPFAPNKTYHMHAMTMEGTSTRWDPYYGTLMIKNSWGTGWGVGGYFWLSEQAFASCAENFVTWNEWVSDEEIDSSDAGVMFSIARLVVFFCAFVALHM